MLQREPSTAQWALLWLGIAITLGVLAAASSVDAHTRDVGRERSARFATATHHHSSESARDNPALPPHAVARVGSELVAVAEQQGAAP